MTRYGGPEGHGALMSGHRDDDELPPRRENDPNRRVDRPMRPWTRKPPIERSPSTNNPEFPQGGIGKAMAEMIKQMVYDAEFNNIVGLPNDYVKGPEEDK